MGIILKKKKKSLIWAISDFRMTIRSEDISVQSTEENVRFSRFPSNNVQ